MPLFRLPRLVAALWIVALSAAHAQAPQPSEANGAAAHIALIERVQKASIHGPKDIPMAGQAVLHLPAGKDFVPRAEAIEMMHAWGNPGDYANLQGLVMPQEEHASWVVVVNFLKAGYVKDDDAKEWKADELLSQFREGTEEANKERVKMGVTPIEIVDWAEKPLYDANTHRLVWAMSLREKGAPADAEQSVNYNTYALGREGYFTLNLITELKALQAQKSEAQGLLGALDYDAGKRYADFNSSTDHVAEYGLAALVLGVGAKKLGLLALAFAFVAKFAKLALLAVLGVGAAVKKFFFKGKHEAAPLQVEAPVAAPQEPQPQPQPQAEPQPQQLQQPPQA